MEILTTESIEIIKNVFRNDPEIVKKPFNQLINENNLVLIDRYNLDEGIQLVYSNDKNQEKNDYTNAGLVQQALSDLTPADATDERLWVTLCLNQYKKYMLARFKKFGSGKQFFCGGYRQLTRVNGVSRLWWSKYNSQKMNTQNKEIIKLFFDDIDRRQQTIERTTSSSNRKVLKVIFEIVAEQNKAGNPYKRPHYREFMKKINFIGKRKSLPSLDEKTLKKLFLDKYLEN